MAWTGLALTVDGQATLNKAQLSNKMNIKSIIIGDGVAPANFRTQKTLVHQLYEITDLKVDVEDGKCTLTADIPQMDYDYYFREIGLIVATEEGEVLYAYDNCSDSAQYIVSTTGVETTRKRIRLVLNISDVAEITVVDSGILYVAYDDYEETITQLKDDIQSNEKKIEDHLADKENPHGVTVEQLHLENVDNTSDMNKPVSTAQQAALDAYYQQSTGYTNTKISQLINGAPATLDTLGEIANAMQDNADVVEVLEAAIGTKANQAEMESLLGTKLDKTGDVKDNTITYSSSDTSNPSSWVEIALFKTGEKVSAFANKVSTMMKNMRYLYKMFGTTDISDIGDGTITGAINSLNTGMGGIVSLRGAWMQTGAAFDDCNNLPIGYCGYTYGATKNSPGAPMLVQCLGNDDNFKMQIAVGNHVLKTRCCLSGSWSNWA